METRDTHIFLDYQLRKKNEMMRDLRKEIRLCNDILSEYMEIREKCLELRILIVFEHEEQIRGLQRKRVR